MVAVGEHRQRKSQANKVAKAKIAGDGAELGIVGELRVWQSDRRMKGSADREPKMWVSVGAKGLHWD